MTVPQNTQYSGLSQPQSGALLSSGGPTDLCPIFRIWITFPKALKAEARALWPCSLMPSCAPTQTLEAAWTLCSPGSSRRNGLFPTSSWGGTSLGAPGM